MTLGADRAVYEQESLRWLTGGALRPGGVELTDRAAGLLGIRSGHRVLDVGCGCGVTAQRLRERFGAISMGCDLSQVLLFDARCRCPDLPVALADGACLPLKEAACNAVFCECVLSLCPDVPAVLAELHRVLEPGGGLAVSDVYARGYNGLAPKQGGPRSTCLEGMRPLDAMVTDMVRAGFTLTVVEDHTRFLKRLSAELIFSYGSLEAFWKTMLPAGSSCAPVDAFKAAKLGYIMLIAAKGH